MGYRRCMECRGKGYLPVENADIQFLLVALMTSTMVRNGVPVRTCEKCHGRGFKNNFFFR